MTENKTFVLCNDNKTVRGFANDVYSYKGEFVIPDGVEEIEFGAFRHGLAKVFLLPDGLKKIGGMAFEDSKYLQAVFIPDSVEIIDSDVFSDCPNLTIYSEGEPKKGWINEKQMRTEYVTTEEDYVFDFHRGGVSRTEVTYEVENNWNKDARPVVTGVNRKDFLKMIEEENG